MLHFDGGHAMPSGQLVEGLLLLAEQDAPLEAVGRAPDQELPEGDHLRRILGAAGRPPPDSGRDACLLAVQEVADRALELVRLPQAVVVGVEVAEGQLGRAKVLLRHVQLPRKLHQLPLAQRVAGHLLGAPDLVDPGAEGGLQLLVEAGVGGRVPRQLPGSQSVRRGPPPLSAAPRRRGARRCCLRNAGPRVRCCQSLPL
mmetsp:Transcript_111368/g.347137  ORF Transcript_111368/g.347137 Transcript_111368/m.347137 type:complete len:200 (-) Transcript_111368:234-833(-)